MTWQKQFCSKERNSTKMLEVGEGEAELNICQGDLFQETVTI